MRRVDRLLRALFLSLLLLGGAACSDVGDEEFVGDGDAEEDPVVQDEEE